MKTTKILASILISSLIIAQGFSQSKPVAGMVSMESKNIAMDAEQLGGLARVELEKTDKFSVIDKYDTKEAVEKNGVNLSSCFGKNCLVEVGKILKAEKMFSGSAEKFGEKIIITMRMVDVHSSTLEKTQICEFLNLQPEIQGMLKITLASMLNQPVDSLLYKRLTKSQVYEGKENNPGQRKLNSSGPRMGITIACGEAASILQASKNQGGYNAFPVMTQFGYQFETQYLNEGNFQALVEFLPMLTGIDQGFCIPSFTLMNGLRNNVSGWEIAFGPSIGFTRMAWGYFDSNNQWHLEKDWNQETPIPGGAVKRMDSRGRSYLTSGFVVAAGKTFRSGHLNVPVNAYFVPGKDSWRLGLSFGFNNKK